MAHVVVSYQDTLCNPNMQTSFVMGKRLRLGEGVGHQLAPVRTVPSFADKFDHAALNSATKQDVVAGEAAFLDHSGLLPRSPVRCCALGSTFAGISPCGPSQTSVAKTRSPCFAVTLAPIGFLQIGQGMLISTDPQRYADHTNQQRSLVLTTGTVRP